MNILVVDDSDIFRSRLIEFLSSKNNSNKIFEANNILEAKEFMIDIFPDVIITDIRMPGGSGLELIKEMRKQNEISLAIVITNYPEEQYKTEAIKAGADYFFDKSNDIEKLADLINKLNNKKVSL